MTIICRILYVILQCTWGILQSIAGFFYMLRYRHCRHEWYHGAYVTYFTGWTGGISLGMFVFVGERTDKAQHDYRERHGAEYTEDIQQSILVHEYGHTIQSLILGPLYLLVVGLPSIIWAKSKRNVEYRARTGTKYTSYWCEKWANNLGRSVTHLEPIDN